ncbi:MAG: hypothetical protein KBC84_04305 [Proteobacteria bacterium]|nr:hypothetical protein [Pseudomonadota bacterium]
MANKVLSLLLLAATASNPDSCEAQTQKSENNLEQTHINLDPVQYNTAKVQELSSKTICETLIETSPRGISCLHCMQSEAASQADALIKILVDTCLKNVAVSYLLDGTFSYDENLLKKHIDILTSDNRRLFLHLYFINGPSQRRYKNTVSDGFAATSSPEEFRKKISHDVTFQNKYKNYLQGFNSLIAYANSKNVALSIVPVLEDNLEVESFEKIASLTTEAFQNPVMIGRNPCPGCYDGNDHRVPNGYFQESHSVNNCNKIRNGIITNDGDVTELDIRNKNISGQISLKELRIARDHCSINNNIFILWNASYQGLIAKGSGSFGRKDYSKRDYPLPNESERANLIKFLRGEL